MTARFILATCCSMPLVLAAATGAWAQQDLLRSSPAGSAPAQQAVRVGPEVSSSHGETVTTRSRPELEPLGVRAGSFLIFPKLGVDETWNDNIFAVHSDDKAKSDFITDVKPSVAVQSDWPNHMLSFSTGADFGMYSDYSRQDYTDFFVNGDGRLDITRDSALYAGGGFAREHEEPGEPDFNNDAKTPTDYYVSNGYLRHIQRLGRFRGVGEADILRLNYDKVNTLDGSEQSTAGRDRTVYSGGYQLGYEFVPKYEAFVRADGNRREYDDNVDAGGVDRTSDGFTAVTGVSLDLGGVLFGDIFAGYMAQYFSGDLNDIDGFTAGGTLTWNVTTLTTLNARVQRYIQDTTQEGSPGILRTTGALSADHELLRNLILSSGLTITNDNYADSNRTDYYYIYGIGARYLMNRNVYGTLGYQLIRHTTDGSDTTDNSYWQNLVRIGIEAQL